MTPTRAVIGGRWSFAILVVLVSSAAACVAPPGARLLPQPTDRQGSLAIVLDSAAPVVVSQDGLTMTVAVDKVAVGPGDPVRVTLTLTNNRTTPATYLDAGCGMHVLATAELAVPVDPPGRDWTGIDSEFKSEALAHALGPGGISYREPYPRPFGPPCLKGGTDRDLAPGATVTGTGVWAANLTRGITAVPGPVPVVFSVEYDLSPQPSLVPPNTVVQGAQMPSFKEISATSQIMVTGSGPAVLSAGQAIDAALADTRFVGWLHEQPASRWSNINLYLDGDGWHVELFRDQSGAQRNWATATVQPVSGAVTQLDICASPCDR